jgi:ribosomal protein S18 acetylase RimI-like enzyme
VIAVYFRDVLVGAICCRIEPSDDNFKLYILTLGVLEPYRRLGIGARMLAHIEEKVAKDPGIKEIYLHVQDGNEAALQLYRSHAFGDEEHVADYYKNIEPSGAVRLRKVTNS